MIKNQTIIVFSDEWGRHPFSCQHIMKHFLTANKLIWVTPTGMRNPALTWYDVKRCVEKLRIIFKKRNRAADERSCPQSITPFTIPYSQFSFIRALNRHFVIRAVKACPAWSEQAVPIILTTLPITADYVKAFAGKLVVYYCVDDFVHWPGVDSSLMSMLENRLIRNSNLMIVSSDELARVKSGSGIETVLIPHGVDAAFFANSHRGALRDSSQKPVIGFFGALSPWLNYELMYQVAECRRDWSFVFIGPSDTDLSRFNNLDNVTFTGKVPYTELPAHAASFDVGIIPFKINELTISVNPLKLLEYFACGLPVVSTNLPEVRKFLPYVSIADEPADFIAAIELELAHNTAHKVAERRQIAHSHSWQSVAEHFSAVIEAALARENNGCSVDSRQ